MLRTVFIISFLFLTSHAAHAQRQQYCNPIGSSVKETIGGCADEALSRPKSNALIPSDLLLNAVKCDVGHAALVARGKKYGIDSMPFTIEVSWKNSRITTNDESFGLSGIIPFAGATLGLTTNPVQVTTDDFSLSQKIEGKTAQFLVSDNCGETGFRGRYRTARYASWLRPLTEQVSQYRRGTLYEKGTVTFNPQFTTTNSIKSGFNLNFILLVSDAHTSSLATTQGLKVTSGKVPE
jgi:hypothetical protein